MHILYFYFLSSIDFVSGFYNSTFLLKKYALLLDEQEKQKLQRCRMWDWERHTCVNREERKKSERGVPIFKQTTAAATAARPATTERWKKDPKTGFYISSVVHIFFSAPNARCVN